MRLLSLLLLGTVLTLGACKSSEKASSKKANPYLPERLQNIDFKWPMQRVADIRDLRSEDMVDEQFRVAVYQHVKQGAIEGVAYYFDGEGEKPLYELIVQYVDEPARDAAAKQLLGAPNYENNKEWLLDTGRGYKLRAWKFKTKLVLVALLPGTEWYEDMNGKD